MTEDQIKHMVGRFLMWRLPENFSPDGGISFKAAYNEHSSHPMKHEPVGTNLFDAVQAEAMVRHMTDGMPPAASGKALTAEMLADALGCFWNAAIGDAQHKQDSTALAVASSMAEGFAAIESRLREHAQPAPTSAVDGEEAERIANLEAFHKEVWDWLVYRGLADPRDDEWDGFTQIIEEHEEKIEDAATRAALSKAQAAPLPKAPIDAGVEPFPQPDRNRKGKEPCGECRIRTGETCDICGARLTEKHIQSLDTRSIPARAAIEAQYGLNDVFPGDPYPAPFADEIVGMVQVPPDAFITATSGDGKPYVKFVFQSLKEMQDFHNAIMWAGKQ
ncbi:hypothetical protein NKJ09_23435 [Mesorhizobium sp. M0189]|uniref:hypothetical protein n=1 Tax=Mesorhizobium sp. M0189 TaxID=2956909 RepID=UPI0033369BE2